MENPYFFEDQHFGTRIQTEHGNELIVAVLTQETTFYSLKKLHAKKRKIVDGRASKSRMIRYNVYEHTVNFMAPKSMAVSPMLPELNNLFGLNMRKPASVVW